MVSVENTILVSTVVLIVHNDNPLVGVIQCWKMILCEHIADTLNHTLNYVWFVVIYLWYI